MGKGLLSLLGLTPHSPYEDKWTSLTPASTPLRKAELNKQNCPPKPKSECFMPPAFH